MGGVLRCMEYLKYKELQVSLAQSEHLKDSSSLFCLDDSNYAARGQWELARIAMRQLAHGDAVQALRYCTAISFEQTINERAFRGANILCTSVSLRTLAALHSPLCCSITSHPLSFPCVSLIHRAKHIRYRSVLQQLVERGPPAEWLYPHGSSRAHVRWLSLNEYNLIRTKVNCGCHSRSNHGKSMHCIVLNHLPHRRRQPHRIVVVCFHMYAHKKAGRRMRRRNR